MTKMRFFLLFLSTLLLLSTAEAQKKRKSTNKKVTKTVASTKSSTNKGRSIDYNLPVNELFKRACDAVDNEDSVLAVQYFTHLANVGHPQAMCAVGRALIDNDSGKMSFTREDNGASTKSINSSLLRPNGLDIKRGRMYLEKVFDYGKQKDTTILWAIEQSANELGWSYYDTKDYSKAIFYFKESAEISNDKYAMYGLGCIYDDLEDHTNAFKWEERGAELGHVVCMRMYGYDLVHGVGCTADPQRGVMWLKKADELNDEISSMLLSWYYYEENKYAKAAYWAHQHIKKKKDSDGYFQLGLLYHFELGVDKDNKKAIEYLREAMEFDKDNLDTMNLLAKCYSEEDNASYKDEAKKLVTKVLESKNATDKQKDNARGILDSLNK